MNIRVRAVLPGANESHDLMDITTAKAPLERLHALIAVLGRP